MVGLFLFLLLSLAQAGIFNLDELENVQYSVDILDVPVSYGDKGDVLSENAVTMVNKFGQKYHCMLPVQSEGDNGLGTGPEEPIDVRELLAPLYESPASLQNCLVRTKDWWTYQVCFGDKITQYHVVNEKPSGVIMTLGTFNPLRKEDDLEKLSYYPEWYTNGTKCDLTGLGRETQLRFVCNEQATQEFIGDIFEPKSCEYVIVVHTDKICSVPHLKPTAESAPLGINCQPILSEEQVEKYQEYAKLKARKAELKLKAAKKQQQQFLNMLNGKLDPVSGGPGAGALEKLMKELGSFVDSALAGASPKESVKIVAMHEPTDSQGATESASKDEAIPDVEQLRKEQADGEQKWNLISKKKDITSDRKTNLLKEERNAIWERIHENKHLLKKFTSQLKDTETFLQNNLEKELKYDAGIIEKLEIQKKQLEKAIDKAKATLTDLEVEEKIAKQKLNDHLRNLMNANEKFLELYRELKLLRLAELPEQNQYHAVLAKVMRHYKELTGERLTRFNDWFEMANYHVDDEDLFIDVRKFYFFADAEIPEILEKMADEVRESPEEASKDLDGLLKQIRENEASLGGEGKLPLDQVKKNVKGEFNNILKEAMEELDIQEMDLEKVDESMDLMEDELDKLLEKLKGAEEQVDQSIRKMERGGKHDGKRSVKKELRDDDDGPEEAEQAQQALKETKKKLKEIETELDQVEVGLKEKKKQLIEENEKVDVEFKKMTEKGLESLDGEGSQELAKKIESSLKEKLDKLGLDGDKPIEIKVITTSIPLAGEDLEGMAGSQYDGMVHNLMYGNQQGYQDIDSQRLTEKNYKFSWDEEMMDKLNEELESLEDPPTGAEVEEAAAEESSLDQQAKNILRGLMDEAEDGSQEQDIKENLYDIVKENVGDIAEDLGLEYEEADLDEALSIVGGMFGVGEERTRPSSRQPSTTTDPQEDGQSSGGNGEGGEGGGEGGEGGSTEADEVIDSEQPRDEL